MNGNTHSKWQCSVAMLNYQRVYPINFPLNHYKIPLNHYKRPLNIIVFDSLCKKKCWFHRMSPVPDSKRSHPMAWPLWPRRHTLHSKIRPIRSCSIHNIYIYTHIHNVYVYILYIHWKSIYVYMYICIIFTYIYYMNIRVRVVPIGSVTVSF